MPRNKKNSKKITSKRNNNSQMVVRSYGPAPILPPKNSKRSSVPRSLSRKVSPQTMFYACSLSDPFCNAAVGAKIPGSSALRSVPFSSRSLFGVTSNSAGNYAHLFCPAYLAFGADATTITGPPYVANYTSIPSFAPIGTDVSGYRIVSWGFQFIPSQAPLDRQGTMCLRSFGAKDSSSFGTIGISTYNCSEALDLSLGSIDSLYAVGHRISPEYEFFTAPTTSSPSGTMDTPGWISPGWGAIQLSGFGLTPSSVVGSVALFINYEIIFNDLSGNAMLSTPALPANPRAKQIADGFQANKNKFYNNNKENINRSIENILMNVAMTGLSYAADALPAILL
jgi:hypothetical protein